MTFLSVHPGDCRDPDGKNQRVQVVRSSVLSNGPSDLDPGNRRDAR